MQLDLRRPAVFLPADPPRAGVLAVYGEGPDEIELALPAGRTVRRTRIATRLVPLAEALPALLAVPVARADPAQVHPVLAAWATAATAGVGLVARGRLLPTASPGGYDAWRVGPLDPADAAWLAELAAAFPPDAHALPVPDASPLRIWSPERRIRALWDAIANVTVRTAVAARCIAAPAFAALGAGGRRRGPARQEPAVAHRPGGAAQLRAGHPLRGGRARDDGADRGTARTSRGAAWCSGCSPRSSRSVTTWRYPGSMAFQRINADHRVMAGVPCIRGTRIPVATLIGLVAEGMTTGEILVDFPQLTADDVREALQFAAAAVDQATLPLPASA